jgi:hypothetical protein
VPRSDRISARGGTIGELQRDSNFTGLLAQFLSDIFTFFFRLNGELEVLWIKFKMTSIWVIAGSIETKTVRPFRKRGEEVD